MVSRLDGETSHEIRIDLDRPWRFLVGPLNPLWVPYGAFVHKSWGNPNWDAYASQPGSTYDSAANPPQTIGTVAYNPYAPLASVYAGRAQRQRHGAAP